MGGYSARDITIILYNLLLCKISYSELTLTNKSFLSIYLLVVSIPG